MSEKEKLLIAETVADKKVISEAEIAVKKKILEGLTTTWHLNNPIKARDAIFDLIIDGNLVWALKECINNKI